MAVLLGDIDFATVSISLGVINAELKCSLQQELSTAKVVASYYSVNVVDIMMLKWMRIISLHYEDILFKVNSYTLSADSTEITFDGVEMLQALGDVVIFGKLSSEERDETTGEVTNVLTTTELLDEILSRQTDVLFEVGIVDVDEQNIITLENISLLEAVYEVINSLSEPCYLHVDYSTRPFKIDILKLTLPDDPNRIIKTYSDAQILDTPYTIQKNGIVNRIYPLGAGDGDNRVNICEFNGGVCYVEDANSIAEHGVYEKILINNDIEDPETLMNWANKELLTKTIINLQDVTVTYPYTLFKNWAVDEYTPRLNWYIKVVKGGTFVATQTEMVTDLSYSQNQEEIAVTIGTDKLKDFMNNVASVAKEVNHTTGATNQFIVSLHGVSSEEKASQMSIWLPHFLTKINYIIMNFTTDDYQEAIDGVVSHPELTLTTENAGEHDHGMVSDTRTDTAGDHNHNLIIPELPHTLTYKPNVPIPKGSITNITIDGSSVPLNQGENVVDYFSKDADGKIERIEHKIEVETDALSLVQLQFFFQTYNSSTDGTDL